MQLRKTLDPSIYLLSVLLVSGCISMATDRMADNLSNAMLNQSDPEIVRAGAPAYLLLIDSMVADNPDDRNLLLAAARLYSAYGNGLVEEPVRQKKLAAQAMAYADRAFCPANEAVCVGRSQPYDQFSQAVTEMDTSAPEIMFTYASSWLGYINSNRDDWNAIAELPKVELLLERLVGLDPGFQQGKVQLYLGILHTLRPAAMGGKPELGKQHFERAIDYSDGKDLAAKVAYAKGYARLVFDQRLHDRLLKEVLEADPHHPGLTLGNVLAQEQARVLLNDDYF